MPPKQMLQMRQPPSAATTAFEAPFLERSAATTTLVSRITFKVASLYHPQFFTSPEACGFGSKAQGGSNHAGHRLAGIDEVAGGDRRVLRDEGEGRRVERMRARLEEYRMGSASAPVVSIWGTPPKSWGIPILCEVKREISLGLRRVLLIVWRFRWAFSLGVFARRFRYARRHQFRHSHRPSHRLEPH